jgi:PAS domain S-box-containing protein
MNGQPVRVLLIEDDLAYAYLLRETLANVGSFPVEVTHVTRLSEALQPLSRQAFEAVLLDLSLPDSQGISTYTRARALKPSLPIIVLTGLEDEKLAVRAVREGAQDYLVKGALDGKTLARAIRYAIERKRAEEALRQREEFFRLISENVTDLIAVIDRQGRRLYNSPSYQNLLGEPELHQGTTSFAEIHPEDRDRAVQIFQSTLATGIGQRAEYRLLLKDGAVRYIESLGSPIRDDTGRTCKLVVVSRDITERKGAVEVLRAALSDLKRSHEELKATQLKLVQSERLEAVSTFAAGVAHEVKNPLQTIILGVDYLSNHILADDVNATTVLADLSEAVQRADAIIRGLLEFSACTNRTVRNEDLSAIVEQSLRAVKSELANYPVRLAAELAEGLPLLQLDAKTIKHVFINLFIYAIRSLADGGKLIVRTYTRKWLENLPGPQRPSEHFRAGETVVFAEVEASRPPSLESKLPERPDLAVAARPEDRTGGLGLIVLRKIIELSGGVFEGTKPKEDGHKFTIMFRAPNPS